MLLNKVNGSAELGAVPFELDTQQSLGVVSPVLATPAVLSASALVFVPCSATTILTSVHLICVGG